MPLIIIMIIIIIIGPAAAYTMTITVNSRGVRRIDRHVVESGISV